MQSKRWLACLLALLTLLGSARAQTFPTPGCGSCGQEYCYWETPMDITDTEAVWNMLIQPMTVVSGNQRLKELLYAAPDETAQPVGEVTCQSQGVHVLETLDSGWSLVECYSGSDSASQLEVYGELVQGYIQTEKLEQVETKTKFGLVADKLTQRLYVFHQGELLTILRISTGMPTEEAPQNETCSGEFHLVSMVGSYVSGGYVICEHAIRFNDGDLLHCVPYEIGDDGEKDYSRYERYLGRKASNGCIRVQRRRTPEGINMTWLWNRLFDQKQTRLAIWEDGPGRQLAIPAADTPIYVLPGLSGAYHRCEDCFGIDHAYWPMEAIAYSQLEEEAYSGLSNCYYCNPPLRIGQLEEINQSSAAAQ